MYRILKGCPRCAQHPVRASKLRGPLEWLRHWLTRRRPFRCLACQWRGWADESWERRQRTVPSGAAPARRATDSKPPKTPGT